MKCSSLFVEKVITLIFDNFRKPIEKQNNFLQSELL